MWLSTVRALHPSCLQVLVLCVLLCSWLELPQIDHHRISLLEMFAGTAMVAKATRVLNKSSVALDVAYDSLVNPGAMDITTDSGFALLCLD